MDGFVLSCKVLGGQTLSLTRTFSAVPTFQRMSMMSALQLSKGGEKSGVKELAGAGRRTSISEKNRSYVRPARQASMLDHHLYPMRHTAL